ncbi:MAG: branched-chain amino acid ABC transporter substrate-binding protein [Methylovirgula sp.]
MKLWLPALLLLLATPAAAEVRIGLGAPLTGPDAVFGAELRNGVEQAVLDINAKGGILGQHLVLRVGDDGSDPKKGVAVANKFVAQKMSFVVGHFNSTVTLPTSEIYSDHGILDITPASVNPQVTERGLDFIFRTCGRDDQQAGVAAKYLAAQGAKKIAILHDRTTYGKDLADKTRKALLDLGVKDVLYDGVDKGEKDYSAIIARIKASGADFLYWGGDAADAGLIVRQMRARGINTVLVGPDSIASDDFAAAGGDAVAGTLMTMPPDPRWRPEAAQAVARFEARGIDPEAYTLYAYAAVEVIEGAAEAANSLDPAAMAKVMHSGVPFKTVLGTISYDVRGDRTEPDYVMFVWKKGIDGKIEYDRLGQ